MKMSYIFLIVSSFAFAFCSSKTGTNHVSMEAEIEPRKLLEATPADIVIKKDFLYDQHTLADTFAYKKTTRVFQWDKIRERLFLIDSLQSEAVSWGVIQNNKNTKGKAALVRNSKKNVYNHTTDAYDVEQYQAAPVYLTTDSVTPERYARDGRLVKVLNRGNKFTKVDAVYITGEWLVPSKFVKFIADSIVFKKAIFVDRTNQDITTMERVDNKWLVRSMNPATTGLHKPPYMQETPTGIFVLQEKRPKMLYYKDGTEEMGGFAPYANRFSGGAFIHGTPIDLPRTEMVEISSTLGTTPRSHMCVRNATSHAKFVYEWAPVFETLVFVFD